MLKILLISLVLRVIIDLICITFHISNSPVELQCYLWLVSVKVMCANACDGLNVHIVLVKDILVVFYSIFHFIQTLPLRERGKDGQAKYLI